MIVCLLIFELILSYILIVGRDDSHFEFRISLENLNNISPMNCTYNKRIFRNKGAHNTQNYFHSYLQNSKFKYDLE